MYKPILLGVNVQYSGWMYHMCVMLVFSVDMDQNPSTSTSLKPSIAGIYRCSPSIVCRKLCVEICWPVHLREWLQSQAHPNDRKVGQHSQANSRIYGGPTAGISRRFIKQCTPPGVPSSKQISQKTSSWDPQKLVVSPVAPLRLSRLHGTTAGMARGMYQL